MNSNQKWVFIINPVAGDGYGSKIGSTLAETAARFGISADLVFSERRGHASEIALAKANEGYTHIIGVGGDGTFNEVASSLVNRENVVTGLVPAGTGNDFVQILGFPDRLDDLHWEKFFRCSVRKMDAGLCNGRYFFNGMGLGFDAQVAAENYTETGEEKKGGKSKFIWQILKTLLFFREKRMSVLNNGSSFETDCFINTVSVGRRFAGGFFLTPLAVADDGLLDVCSIKRLNLVQRLRILTMVPKGSHINDKKVHYYQTNDLRLKFNERVPFHLDGELNFAQDFEIRILRESLSVIYNADGPNFFSRQ